MSNENNICSENFNQENFNNGCMMSYKRELNTRIYWLVHKGKSLCCQQETFEKKKQKKSLED